MQRLLARQMTFYGPARRVRATIRHDTHGSHTRRAICYSCRHMTAVGTTSEALPSDSHAVSTHTPRTLLLVDAMGLIFRQYFGYKNRFAPMLAQIKDIPLPGDANAAVDGSSNVAACESYSTRDVGALYGYASTLLNLCYVLQPTHVAACMDLGNRSSFRHLLFPDYKIDRKPVEDSLRWQLQQLDRVTRALGIQPVRAPGFEADDVIGTLAHAASSSPSSPLSDSISSPHFDRVIILSSDKDFVQCLNPRVSMLSPKQGGSSRGGCYVYLHESDADSVFGVAPHRFSDYLVLLGDTADGIPGVPGVGPVRAQQIVKHYDSLDKALHDIKTLKKLKGAPKGKASAKVYEALLAAERDLPMWSDLATIRTNVDKLPAWNELRYHGPTSSVPVSSSTDIAGAKSSPLLSSPEQRQLQADTIAAVWSEFGFPDAAPSFIPASSTAAVASGAQAPVSADLSTLPKLFTQEQWKVFTTNPRSAGTRKGATAAVASETREEHTVAAAEKRKPKVPKKKVVATADLDAFAVAAV